MSELDKIKANADEVRDDFLRHELKFFLAGQNWNYLRTADALGADRANFIRLLKRLGLYVNRNDQRGKGSKKN